MINICDVNLVNILIFNVLQQRLYGAYYELTDSFNIKKQKLYQVNWGYFHTMDDFDS